MILRIATRGSRLALWQAEYTQARLRELGIESELCIIKTQGDRIQHLSFDKIEGKGFFTKDIEDALLRGDADLAVHSMKDMPTTQPEGLVLAGVSYRDDPADWLIVRREAIDAGKVLKMKENPIVGTSSARRKAQIRDIRPDAQIHDIRGNVPTRLNKLREGQFDAILLAAAGLSRLGLDLSDLEVLPLHPREFVPAPAQGVLVWQCAEHDVRVRRIVQQLHDAEVLSRVWVERRVLKLMGGGCHTPLAAYCETDSMGNYHVWAAMARTWDSPVHYVRLSQSTQHELAERVVEALRQGVAQG